VEGYDKYKLHITVAVEVIVEETACFDSKPFLLQYQQVIEGHTHTHPFNGPLSGTTWVQKVKGKTSLDFTEAKDSEWQWHQLRHTQLCTSL